MTGGEIIAMARAGELKGLSIELNAQSDSVLAEHINMGLIELCKRFPINFGELILKFQGDGVDTTGSTNQYIRCKKQTDPRTNSFTGRYVIYSDHDGLPQSPSIHEGVSLLDIDALLSAWDGNGNQLGINEDGWGDKSIYTLSPYILQIPFAKDNEICDIIYRASPRIIRDVEREENNGAITLIPLSVIKGNNGEQTSSGQDADTFGALNETVAYNTETNLPYALLEPLGAYVGWRATMSKTATVPSDIKTFYQLFETSCQRVTFESSVTPQGVYAQSLYRLDQKGYNTPIRYKGYL